MTMDEESVTNLLRRLDDEPAGPPRIDLPGAIREARRRRRNRRAAVAGAAALGVLAAAALPVALRGGDAAAPAPAGVSVSPVPHTPKPSLPGLWEGKCEAALLPAPDGAALTEVTAGDPDGRWLVGRQSLGPKHYRLLVWDGDQVREVGFEDSVSDAQLNDVNRAGLAVGAALVPHAGRKPWVIRDGQVSQLPGISSGAARAVNDAGRIVGYRTDGNGPGGMPRWRPVAWDSYESRAVDLPLPGPQWEGTAVGIDEDGTILATMTNGDLHQPPRAVVWRPGATRPEVLPLPRVPGGAAFQFLPVSLAGGWVTGSAGRKTKPGEPGTSTMYKVRIDLRTGQSEVLSADVAIRVTNAWGWSAGVLSSGVPAVVTDTKSVTLPGLDGKTGAGGWVRSLSDDGRVVGGQLYVNKRGRAVRWTCR